MAFKGGLFKKTLCRTNSWSSNGTFVNGDLVGKDVEFDLKNGHKIALSHPIFICFTFFKFEPSFLKNLI